MSHNHNRLALIEFIQVLHDAPLVVGIKPVGRLVKEDIVRILIIGSAVSKINLKFRITLFPTHNFNLLNLVQQIRDINFSIV